MESLYKPEGVEERWQRTWEDEGLYNAETDDLRPTYVICLPPPNVTDRLHMGHALNASCPDVHLAEKGYIYRGSRIVNWCPGCASVISDLEVDHIEVDDALSYIRYPFTDGEGSITIATVRPATILADVAVAVHPNDERYKDAV